MASRGPPGASGGLWGPPGPSGASGRVRGRAVGFVPFFGLLGFEAGLWGPSRGFSAFGQFGSGEPQAAHPEAQVAGFRISE